MASTSTKQDIESHQSKETTPLLQGTVSSESDIETEISAAQAAFGAAFKSAASLAKHLPTGTVLVFQILSPVFTNQGTCDHVNRIMASCLVAFLGLLVVFFNFTDSFKDSSGTVRYVVATRTGCWVIDGTKIPSSVTVELYKLKFIDFFHSFMALMVFASVALFDNNIESCFYPVMSYDTKQILTAVPLATGLIGSVMFVVFPSTRHGIGFPISTS
ncbi:hypothetical protein LUZ60_012644 [Juncus effusus]|nr:hypothetical protein LUZ60_012644 [Juncus effusus]